MFWHWSFRCSLRGGDRSGMRPFAQVDVFTSVPGRGNPVAVVLDGSGLDTEQMQGFASWTNLSETTFVLPPTGDADYRLRIFTPNEELPFAGHPTIGTCRALLDTGMMKPQEAIRQECAAGIVELTVEPEGPNGLITFIAPRAAVLPEPPGIGELDPTWQQPLLVDSGPHWLTARVTPAELNDLATAAFADLIRRHGWDLNLYAIDGDQVEVRSFFLVDGLVEDPVCGSGNVAVAAHRRAVDGFRGIYQARQGRHRGRDGRLRVTVTDQIRVGGHAVTVISGDVTI